uniref:Uncharacterized protein n=1 Tax=Arundo donax TaxID=35708 RepID=A0A0A9H476_ARUDO
MTNTPIYHMSMCTCCLKLWLVGWMDKTKTFILFLFLSLYLFLVLDNVFPLFCLMEIGKASIQKKLNFMYLLNGS